MSWLLPISRHGNFSAATRIAVLKRAEGRIHLISLIGQAARELKARGWSSLDTLDWAADSKGFFACSLQRTSTLLHIDLLGNARESRNQGRAIAGRPPLGDDRLHPEHEHVDDGELLERDTARRAEP